MYLHYDFGYFLKMSSARLLACSILDSLADAYKIDTWYLIQMILDDFEMVRDFSRIGSNLIVFLMNNLITKYLI